MIYFTADTHFGHANAVWMCGRPYPDVEVMNEAMIAAWNERVHGNDTVYIVGDMFFRCADPESILRRLKGKKRLIVGNHDGSWMGKVDLNRYSQCRPSSGDFGWCTCPDTLSLSNADMETRKALLYDPRSYSCGY